MTARFEVARQPAFVADVAIALGVLATVGADLAASTRSVGQNDPESVALAIRGMRNPAK